jgi:S1-C subfamily serine protease
VTAVDIVIAIFVVALAAIGYERGLIRSALPLLGFLLGAAIGGRIGPALLTDGSESPYAPVVTVMCGLLLGGAFAFALEGVGMVLRERLGIGRAASRVDGAGGAALLAVLGLMLAWSFAAVALHAPGNNAEGVRSAIQRSAILDALNGLMPPSGPLLNVLRRIDPRPSVEGPEARVRPPDPTLARDPDVQRAGRSVVKVLGTACGLGVEGSGWVARTGLVVTNAHVVAGEDDTTVTTRSGEELDATAVYYEPSEDLAMLRVAGLGAAALAIEHEPQPGTDGAVLGFPENGPFAVSPARLGGTGEVISEDSYGRGPVRRTMTSFRGDVHGGNSGGPLVDGGGRVLATVFAAAQGAGSPGGLGIPNAVVTDALASRLAPVDTGPCAA